MPPHAPRLTSALRSLSARGGGAKGGEGGATTDWTALLKQRAAQEGNSWPSITARLKAANRDKSTPLLREFAKAVSALLGAACDAETVQDACLFVYRTVSGAKGGGSKPWTDPAVVATLKKRFTAASNDVLRDAGAAAVALRALLPDGAAGAAGGGSQVALRAKLLKKPFGHNLEVTADLDVPPAVAHTSTASASSAARAAPPGAAAAAQPPPVAAGPATITSQWLKGRCLQAFGAERGQDMCLAVFEQLSSASDDLMLQTGLFDLLGGDNFDLIADVLAHRYEIVSAVMDNMPSGGMVSAPAPPQGKRAHSRGQQVAGQVTIQSEQEKRLAKQLQREEKRLAKASGKTDRGSLLVALGFDELQRRREAADRAAKAPVFPRRQRAQKVDYPYVFDTAAQSKGASSFVSGRKMLLPPGTTRVNEKMFEKVYIPPTPPSAKVKSFDTLTPITELSDVARLAFKGYKTLNRIQSIVKDTAYRTNENMLVCAPTGAGKTNIAMLTILSTVEQHIEQGVIMKDKFKIVYVAPMKALAAEMTRGFGRRLAPLGLSVKELTGDMQLTKAEIMATNMLITTPEKWDVVTRKSTGDVALTQMVKLLIIDEVHLLHDDRGAVIESLVARTLRQVETSQSLIRIVGLSATLPNYLDAASFLRVNPYVGLFVFDGGFRPVPLEMAFIGVKSTNRFQAMERMDEACFEVVMENVQAGHQVMIFVHARKGTGNTSMKMREIAQREGSLKFFSSAEDPAYGQALKAISRSKNKQVKDLFPDGFGLHHAGMLRSDRSLVEKYFAEGLIKVLCCTATLAWGVNLPAHAVIIKGTQLYNAKQGSFVDLGILDVQQIFGRAGRPQFDTTGEATLITTHDKLTHFLTRMTNQLPIESQFISHMKDNLNAEIALGTVTNIDEAVRWLSYTFLFVRMKKNPLVYGIDPDIRQDDPQLLKKRRELIVTASRDLDKAKMIRFSEPTGYVHITDMGRTASHFYIKHDSVEVFNEMFKPTMTEADIFAMLSLSKEFDNVKVRDDEMDELDFLLEEGCMVHPVKGGVENAHGKVNILLQSYITGASLRSFSLISDMAYVAQNAARILRALFEVAIRKNMPSVSAKLITLCKSVDKRIWSFMSPMRQFKHLSPEILHKIDNAKLSIAKMQDMDDTEIGHMVRHVRMGTKIKNLVEQFPAIQMHATIQPITRTVLRVTLVIEPLFTWNSKFHGGSEPWWIWVEDVDNEHIYHAELYQLRGEHVRSRDEDERNQTLVFTIPIFEPLPSQYYIRAISDRWLGAEAVTAISFQHLILPEQHPPHTELLPLQPLPLAVLGDKKIEALYRFSHFNPVQTQVFHTLYHTDTNVLLGAPTGSGKTACAELAIFRLFRENPKAKAVYVAPLKALVRERIADWKERLERRLGKRVVELTGDTSPDMRAVARADLIVTTPEKWDGISRSWQNRTYVQAVSLLIIDEIHMLGADRGPVLEVIVSRTNYISSHTTHKVRIVGLSTALANAHDLANWLGIDRRGLFNFKPSVRPVPLEHHIDGFPGKHYCPRMATMNKPAYSAIKTYSPTKPTLIFVSSRRQTRLTALDLMAFCATEDNPKQFLHMPDAELDQLCAGVRDPNLRLTLSFGIGLHHAGLHEKDRKVVEELFLNLKIQILVATATLAWGVNLPAHLVVVKGTEFFDGKTKRYVDFDITDVLQMTGRAGRPQFDDKGVAVILCHDIKKHFYKKFMFEPFPVESNLHKVLPDHFNAEIVAGTINSKQEAMDYLTWTYFFRRLVMNPSFYGLDDVNQENVNSFLSSLVDDALSKLSADGCISVDEDDAIEPEILGRIASYYYLTSATVGQFDDDLEDNLDIPGVLELLCNAAEFEELPVRHNEDQLNEELAKDCPMEIPRLPFDSPHLKAHLLLQGHFSRLALPIADYRTDTKSVLDQCVRVLQAMVDIAANDGYLATVLNIMHVTQMVIQGRWLSEGMLNIPHMSQPLLERLEGCRPSITCLPELVEAVRHRRRMVEQAFGSFLDRSQVGKALSVVERFPIISVQFRVSDAEGNGELFADEDYTMSIKLRQENPKAQPKRAHAPAFQKPLPEGYWLVLGHAEMRELLALKRVGKFERHTQVSLSFIAPENLGPNTLTLYLMSDCYIGLDQQYDLAVTVAEGSRPASDAEDSDA